MKRFLAVLLLCWSWSAWSQPVLRNSYTTNSPGKTPNLLPTNTSTLYPLMVLNPDGSGGDRTIYYDNGVFTITGTNGAFSASISLSGTTNRLTIAGNQLLLDGSPISSSGDTTATNIVTLTQTGTNVSSMDYSLVSRGGVFKLVMTGNAYIGAPSGVANTAFTKAWLMVQQPSTGTCVLTFTNGFYAFSEGVQPVIDTNNGAVSVFEFVSDVFTNGLLHGSVSTPSKLIP